MKPRRIARWLDKFRDGRRCRPDPAPVKMAPAMCLLSQIIFTMPHKAFSHQATKYRLGTVIAASPARIASLR